MKSLQKIQFLELHLLQMKHLLHHKLLQNNKMKLQSWILSPLYNLQLQMMSMMRIKLKCSQWAIKELSMKIVLKRTPIILFQQKKAATSSPASEQSGTRVPKGRGGGDLPKISAFPAKTPKSGGRGSSQGDKSPTRPPRFSNTGEGSTISAQCGRNRAAINRQSLSKPPGTIKTATKDKTKSKEKNTPS